MKMNCCGCEKEIDLDKHEVVDDHASWYGRYQGQTCLAVICHDCIQDPKQKTKYNEKEVAQ